ncbi:RnfABCDGE type electron transport complex subunit G [uncultured Cohaesibacter sp.]|uniref:RnfABCDGE type electron transport complex subunit G n=1 Tax=uncultured Cohaesibacter sp. TaxID=1002546 RepID=UPI00292DDAB9|nr:RnfABCDGE type electron transport complex subunit G [uncultured Cohaesibacter sp.]
MSETELNADELSGPDDASGLCRKMTKSLADFHTRFHANPLYLAILLGGFSLICALLLSSSHLATLDPIAQRQKEDLQNSLALVIPAALHDNDLIKDSFLLKDKDGAEKRVYAAYKDGRFEAVAYQVQGIGYGGPILALLGVDRSGKILGVQVLQHSETPGLGDRIEANRSDWLSQFTGLSLITPGRAQWKVKKDGGRFDQLSGATITPRTVVQSILGGLDFFEAHRETLLNCPKGNCEGAGS